MRKKTLTTSTGIRFFLRALTDLRDVFNKPEVAKNNRVGQRILIFNWRDSKHAFAGGAEVYIQEVAKRWVDAGNDVTLFCGSDGRSKRNEVIDGVKIVRRGGFYFVYFWAFVYYVLRFRKTTDVIVDCENGIPFFTPLYAAKKKFLVIHHVHQEIFRKNLKKPFAGLASFLEGKLMPYLYRNVQVITVSESSKQEILEHALTQIEPVIVHNGIDHSTYIPGEKAKSPMVLYVGRLQSYKSLHIFLESAKIILKSVPNAEFIIAGNGEDRKRLTKLHRDLDLKDKVTFLGYISEEEKISLYQKAWVFMNPSIREGWGITSIEANACGTPVVASHVSGLKDSVKHAESGFLVEYGNTAGFVEKIVTILTDEKLRHTLSSGAITWASQFNWDASAQSFYAVMTEESLPVLTDQKAGRFAYLVNKLYSFLF